MDNTDVSKKTRKTHTVAQKKKSQTLTYCVPTLNQSSPSTLIPSCIGRGIRISHGILNARKYPIGHGLMARMVMLKKRGATLQIHEHPETRTSSLSLYQYLPELSISTDLNNASTSSSLMPWADSFAAIHRWNSGRETF